MDGSADRDAVRRRVEAWFGSRGWTVFPYQRAAWDAWRAGESGLIHSPTGTGKSLAAWLGPLMQAMAAPGAQRGLRVVWVTPLKALARDTAENLQKAASELGTEWRIEVRNGDTGSSVRARQLKDPPHCLVTTPESLSLMLSYRDWQRPLSQLETVVVDEWHELLGSKRGVQLELCLAHLRRGAPGLRTWGLSATLGNLEQARDVLLGGSGHGRLIEGGISAETRIRALIPNSMERFPWAGHLGLNLLPDVLRQLEKAETTLLFTNTRAQAELWHEALIGARPAWLETIALHHGSVARGLRERIEEGLRNGSLRCVVCTSSLDLGVDFSPVDQVIQVGSPKGVARLLQRAGRSGHRPGVPSEVVCVPTHAFELVEIAAARRAAEIGSIEARQPLTGCLDVLAQHLVTLGLGRGFEPEAMLREVRGTHAFKDLSDDDWAWILDFLTRGGPALSAYPQYRRLVRADGRLRVTDRRIGRMHRMTVGTITSDASMAVRWQGGGRLGTVEESFIARLKPGDRFLFAGRVLELARVRDMVAWVRRASGGARAVPRWQGGRMPLSTELAESVVALLGGSSTEPVPELRAMAGILGLQADWSRLPAPGELLAECTTSREGHHLFVYPFAGRLVHEGLATLLAWRISRSQPVTFTLSFNDYGFELLAPDAVPVDAGQLRDWLCPEGLAEDLVEALNVSEIARRRFRDIARVAGLVFQGYPGSGKSARQLQASSGLIFDVLVKYDADNRLVSQARREVLAQQLETTRLARTLADIQGRNVILVNTERMTPLAFPLWAERLQSQIISSEDWRTRVMRAADRLERAARSAAA